MRLFPSARLFRPARLYRCPPEIAGDYPAVRVTHPLVRWSRHRELMGMMVRRDARSAWARWLWNKFANVSILLSVVGFLAYFACDRYHSDLQKILISSSFFDVIASMILVNYIIIQLLISFAVLTMLIWLGDVFTSMMQGTLTKNNFLCKFLPSNGNIIERDDHILRDFYMAGIGFRDLFCLLARCSTLDRDQLFRWRIGWPIYWSLFISLLIHGPGNTFYDPFGAGRCLASAGLIIIFICVSLPLKQASVSPWNLFLGLGQKLPWTAFFGYGRAFAKIAFWYVLAWLLCRSAMAWVALRYSTPTFFVWGYYPAVLIWAFALVTLLQKRRVEVFLLVGDPKLHREAFREGGDAFREWIQRQAERPGAL
jgi:hypothetical protein